MFSPSNLTKRVGVGGGLVPFFKCVCVYFAVGAGGGEAGGAGPSAGAVAAKCAPVLCLLLAVLLLEPASPAPSAPDPRLDSERRRYARRVALGLAASALGDALLAWPQHFVAGMAAFGAAHGAYMCAFVPRAPRRLAAAALFAGAALFVRALAPPPGLRAPVALYAALLAGMAARALATPPAPLGAAPARALAAPAGALLFLVSDAVLGYSLFGGPVPHAQALVMSTYYLGQLGLALSALLPPAPPGPPAAPRPTN